ncbi:EAL domain-containing protein [Maricaulis sp.]|uniref:putative bifunctional diguanylate cyclase/phosphodiesterase n=1 Tax=Maricaulis sp. TaxID=1486257 RepID=UPI000C64F52C|nr:EAL domain-containing protein [Maricaulis sp.]MAC90736.1 GGDEF-domain containing protein [Maricaulis sp.]
MRTHRHDPLPSSQKAEADAPLADEVVVAYQPILNGATIAILLFVLYDLLTRLIFPNPIYDGPMLVMNVVGLTTLSIVYMALRRNLSSRHLEIAGGVICLVLFLNSNLQQLLSFEQENLVYSILMMPIFATLLPRRRAIVIAVAFCCAALAYLVHVNLPHMTSNYLSVGLAGVMAAVAIAVIIRNSVLNAVKARLEAVRDRETAEQLERDARHLAECDALTGLPNRRSFFLALDQHIERLRSHGEPFILGLVDLDGFKPVNDTYGHAAGDEMLKTVAERLCDIADETVTPARLGGDEFALLAAIPCTLNETALALGHRVEAALSEPYELGEYTCKSSGSVGLLICNDPQVSAQELMERADHALYFAKRALQGKAVVFNAALEQEMTASSQLDKALRRSDHEAEFSVKFQPQYDLVKSKVTGFEALARWDSPELGSVTPDLFIPAAERAGLIRGLTQTLLSKALREMASWPTDITLSFNLSAHDLMSPQAMDSLLDTVRQSGLPASRIEFEITETAMMSDFNQARRAIDQISAAGHSIALDDFGVGYSSLQYLQQLPVSKLKIDRSFVSQMLEDSSSFKIVRTMLALSQSLDLGCVIEGVETEAQVHILRTLGARHVQGYLIGAPMGADQIDPILSTPMPLRKASDPARPPSLRRARA